MGEPSYFRKQFENPILRGREADASDADRHRGDQRSEELSTIVNHFIIRRTNSLLAAHLPPKVTQIVVCSLTKVQEELYEHFLNSKVAREVLNGGKKTGALGSILLLRMLCNHPKLILDKVMEKKSKKSLTGFEGGEMLIPDSLKYNPKNLLLPELGGKFSVLANLLSVHSLMLLNFHLNESSLSFTWNSSLSLVIFVSKGSPSYY